MTGILTHRPASSTLLSWLVETPEAVRELRALTPGDFSLLVRRVGVEDAGEIVAVASTEQLIAAFDEDLFTSRRPGERERFDAGRFVPWLEVLLEAGDQVAAARCAELSEDFLVHALSSLVMALDQDGLRLRMDGGGRAAGAVDKALEGALSEELDGYLLVARHAEGWDAVLSLCLALDRDHRALLERILDRSAALNSGLVEDLDELWSVLSEEESLAEDVEAERETRRARAGFVEPRAARGFLELATHPLPGPPGALDRDPLTQVYFRDLDLPSAVSHRAATGSLGPCALLGSGKMRATAAALPSPDPGAPPPVGDVVERLLDALSRLGDEAPGPYRRRMSELGYLANVLTVAGTTDGDRMHPSEAALAALATVALGAELVQQGQRNCPGEGPIEVLRTCPADILFRTASAHLAARPSDGAPATFLRTRAELDAALVALAP